MTRVSKKVLAVLLCSAMLTAMTGCGSSTTADSGNAPAPAAESAAPAAATDGASTDTAAAASGVELSGDLDIWAWGADDEAKAREGAIEIFISEHPELNYLYHHSHSRQCLGSESGRCAVFRFRWRCNADES